MSLKNMFAGVLLVGAAVVGLACSGGDGASADRVKELEAEVASLQQQLADARAASAGEATATAVAPAVKEIADYGFSITVPADLDVTTAGTREAQASTAAGQMTADDGNVSMVLVWSDSGLSPQEAVVGAYEVLVAASTGFTLTPASEGDLAVSGDQGAFGAFTVGRDGQTVGFGIAGGWSCTGRTFSLTVLGADSALVEQAFAGLTGYFRCGA